MAQAKVGKGEKLKFKSDGYIKLLGIKRKLEILVQLLTEQLEVIASIKEAHPSVHRQTDLGGVTCLLRSIPRGWNPNLLLRRVPKGPGSIRRIGGLLYSGESTKRLMGFTRGR